MYQEYAKFYNNNRSNSQGNRSKSQTNGKYSQGLAIVGRNAITNNNSMNKLVSKNQNQNLNNQNQNQNNQQFSQFQQQQFSGQKQNQNLNNKIYNQQDKFIENNPYFQRKSEHNYNHLEDLKNNQPLDDPYLPLKLTPQNSNSRRQNPRNFKQNPQSAHPSSHLKNQNQINIQQQKKKYYQNDQFFNSGNNNSNSNNIYQNYEPEYQDFYDRQARRNGSQDNNKNMNLNSNFQNQNQNLNMNINVNNSQKLIYNQNNNLYQQNFNQNQAQVQQQFFSKHPPLRSAKSREAKNSNNSKIYTNNVNNGNNHFLVQNSMIFEQNNINNLRDSQNLNSNFANNRPNRQKNPSAQQNQQNNNKQKNMFQNKNKRQSKIPRPPIQSLSTENDELNSFIQENLKYNEMRQQHTEMPEIKENDNMLLSNDQSKMLKEYSFLNNTSTVLIFDGGSQLDNDFFKDQKEDLDIKQINDHLRTCAEIDKSIIQLQVLEGDLQDIRLSYDYFDLIKKLILSCHKIGLPKQNNENMIFYLKYFTFCLQGVEELLFREDIEDESIFDDFLNSFSFKITSQLQQQVINEFAKRNGKRFFYLSEQKRLNFWNFLKNYLKKIKLQISQTDSFLDFYECFEQILKNNQIRQDLQKDQELQTLIQQNIQKKNLPAIFLNLIQQRYFKKIEINLNQRKTQNIINNSQIIQNSQNQQNIKNSQITENPIDTQKFDNLQEFTEICHNLIKSGKITNPKIHKETQLNLKKLEKILNLNKENINENL